MAESKGSTAAPHLAPVIDASQRFNEEKSGRE